LIPIFRTRHMESAVNLLLKNFRTVLVYCAYANVHHGRDLRVRFRADKIKDQRVFFDRTKSQVKRWRERGGALIVWSNRNRMRDYDAMVFAEAPRRIEALYEAQKCARHCAVIYEPPSWNPHIEITKLRHAEHPAKLRRAVRDLAIMESYVSSLPLLSRRSLLSRLPAQEESSRSSFAPGSPEGAERSAGRTG